MVNQEDLRINQPFKELIEFCCDTSQFDLATLAETAVEDETAFFDQAHIPYVVIILQTIQGWKMNCNGNLPKTFDEKKEFKNMIKMTCTDISKQ